MNITNSKQTLDWKNLQFLYLSPQRAQDKLLSLAIAWFMMWKIHNYRARADAMRQVQCRSVVGLAKHDVQHEEICCITFFDWFSLLEPWNIDLNFFEMTQWHSRSPCETTWHAAEAADIFFFVPCQHAARDRVESQMSCTVIRKFLSQSVTSCFDNWPTR